MNSNEKRDQLRAEYVKRLSGYTWNWFITLRVTTGRPSKRRLVKLFDKWIESLKKEEGGNNFRWVCVRDDGFRVGDSPRLHILVGGLRSRRQRWEKRWRQLGGNADIQPFDQTNAISYMLKSIDEQGDLDIDYELRP